MKGYVGGVRSAASANNEAPGGRRTWALALAPVCLIAAATPAMALPDEPSGPTTPEHVAEILESVDFQPSEPPSESEIAASEDAYANLSDAEAIDVAGDAFPDLIDTRLVPELELSADQHAGDFLAANAVQVVNEGPTPDAVLESTLPVRAPEAGAPELLDADLVSQGDHYEADNPVVDTEIGADPSDGFEIPEAGVAVIPESDPAADTTVVEDKVFIANSARDTDTLVAPTATGASVNYLVRSADAPEVEHLDFELPAGAQLVLRPDGSAQIVKDAEPLAAIHAPSAVDAAGQTVDVRYEHAPGGLDVVVSHRDSGHVYPINVDPVVDYYGWHQGDTSLATLNWYESHPAYEFFSPLTAAWPVPGVMNRAPANTAPPVGSFSRWAIGAYPDSYIEQLDFWYANQISPAGDPQTCAIEGIWDPTTNYWTTGRYYDAQAAATSNPAIYAAICGVQYNQTRQFYVGNSNVPDLKNLGDPEGADNNSGIFMLLTTSAAWWGTQRTTYADSGLSAATAWLYDWYAPTIEKIPGDWETEWVDDSDPFDQTQRATFNLRDKGLGWRTLEVRNGTSPTSPLLSSRSHPCNGGHAALCPSAFTLGIEQLPEGVTQNVTARAIDAGGTPSAPVTWTAKIDRTAPVLDAPTGSLHDERADLLTSMDYELSVSASDGSAMSPRSGVVNLALRVDGQQLFPTPVFDDDGVEVKDDIHQPCPQGSCGLQYTFAIPAGSLAPGPHTVQPVATDGAGNTTPLSTRAFSVNLREDQRDPTLDINLGSPNPAGQTPLTFTASDPSQAGWASGIVSYEVDVDNQTIAQDGQSCGSAGGCTMNHQRTLTAAQNPSDHEIVVTTHDRAGNSAITVLGKATTKYANFGYSTDNLPQLEPQVPGSVGINRAREGGANMIRLFLNWCAIADSPPTPPMPPGTPAPTQDPATWRWNAYSSMMERIKEHNIANHTNRLKVVLVLADSPYWANGNGSQGHCSYQQYTRPDGVVYPGYTALGTDTAATPPADNATALQGWNNFVQGVLDRWGPAHDDAPPGTNIVGDDRYNVVAIEAWNEPNLDRFWGTADGQPLNTQPDRFADLVDRAYSVVDLLNLENGPGNPTTNARVKVLPGGLTPDKIPTADLTPREFMEQSLGQMNPGSVDRLSIHLYANTAESDRLARLEIDRKWNKFVNGIPDGSPIESRPRWITEIGFPSVENEEITSADVNKQRTRMLRSYRHYAKAEYNVEAFLVHRLFDPPPQEEAGGFGLMYGDSTSTVFSDNCYKPAYASLAKQETGSIPAQPTGVTCPPVP